MSIPFLCQITLPSSSPLHALHCQRPPPGSLPSLALDGGFPPVAPSQVEQDKRQGGRNRLGHRATRSGYPQPPMSLTGHLPIYGVRRTSPLNSFQFHAQIIQLYAGECPSNSVDCLTLHDQLMKTYNQLFLANPTDRNARQWSSSSPPGSSTGSHFSQLDLLGTAEYIVFISWSNLFIYQAW